MNRIAKNAAIDAIDGYLNEVFIEYVTDESLVALGLEAYFDKLGDNDADFEEFEVIKSNIVKEVARSKAFFTRIAEEGPSR